MTVKIGKTYKFNYPKEFVTLPEYSAHRGQQCVVIRPLTSEEADPPSEDMEGMFRVRFGDGWEGEAFESELVKK